MWLVDRGLLETTWDWESGVAEGPAAASPVPADRAGAGAGWGVDGRGAGGSGLRVSVWAIVLGGPLVIAAWLAEAPSWARQLDRLLTDGEGGYGGNLSIVGVNLSDAVWWTLIILVVWALPLGVLGAAVGSARARRQDREHPDPGLATG